PVALDHALEAASLRRARHPDPVAFLELVHLQFLADLVAVDRRDAELLEETRRIIEACLLCVTDRSLRRARRLQCLEAELQRAVSVRFRVPDLRDRTRPRFDHGDRYGSARVTEDLGHAQLPSDDSCHG